MTIRARTARRTSTSIWRALGLAILFACFIPFAAAAAADRAQLLATSEKGYGRMVLSFVGRIDLPKYNVKYDNGVLAINFTDPVDAVLPDVALALADYVTVARVDPDNRGIRVGLRAGVTINRMEAGEQLFIDLLPPGWQGLPPALPPEVVAELTARAKKAAEIAAQEQKAALAKAINPVATLRVGMNPTFMRIQIAWTADTQGSFRMDGNVGRLTFDWPVPVDIYPLQADPPPQLLGSDNTVAPSGTTISLNLAKGVVPRFYQIDAREFVVDIDIPAEQGIKAAITAEAAAELARKQRDAEVAGSNHPDGMLPEGPDGQRVPGGDVQPTVATIGNTVRLTFPFDADTPSAVFRRGDTVWMVFDSPQKILAPSASDALQAIASGFEVTPAGNTQIVRLDLSIDRLATLGSEGRSWVLSLGDTVMGATEPISLERERDVFGHFEVLADVARPGQVHDLRDPVVGDTLQVVTVMPPARGVARDLGYVDFAALRSAHGLVIKPLNDALKVAIEDKAVVISSKDGLTMSDAVGRQLADAGTAAQFRESYLDLEVWREEDPSRLIKRQEDIENRAAAAEGRQRDLARLDLATLLVANELSFEAIGVLDTLSADLSKEDLRKKLNLTLAIADVFAGRHADALAILNGGTFPNESDALMWRAIAREQAGDYKGSRMDAMAAQPVVASYPDWIRTMFGFAALRSAVETNDAPMALRLIGEIEFAKLSPEDVSTYELMQGRIAELEGQLPDALDSYGQVIAADVRPTRAEAVYRTLMILNKTGKIDLAKATQTLAAESMLWRGDALEANMDRLLAELYFQNKAYRDGFTTTQQAAARFPDNQQVATLTDEASRQFADLFLNGGADQLSDVDALSLYYDFRQLTPPGTRGDQMIRNLARRLVKVDLLTQAADLLQYQVDSRLKGAARAQVGADVALIRIADRKPDLALKALNDTRLADLPPELDRQRRVLEARAMIDAGREQLAIELIRDLKGRDADMLRIDGYWKSKDYSAAANLIETMYTPADAGIQMTQAERMGVVKAAVGYAIVGDKVGQSRLRSKFSDQMANSAEWPVFNYLTGTVDMQSPEFRMVAGQVAGLDSLDAFLTSYKQLYASGDALNPNKAAAKSG